jgi:hypothetical protein
LVRIKFGPSCEVKTMAQPAGTPPPWGTGPYTSVDPDLPTRARRRLAEHDPTARVEDNLPLNKPIPPRQRLWAAALAVSPLFVGVVSLPLIMLSTSDEASRQADAGYLMWAAFGFLLAIWLAMGVGNLVAQVRTHRKRARRLRRRYAGRYFSPANLQALRDRAPHLADLAAQAQHQRRRLAHSQTWRDATLPTTLTDRDLDAQEWQIVGTVQALAATTDEIHQASEHPELARTVRDTQIDMESTTAAVRARVAQLTTLADAATAIDAALTASQNERARLHRRDEAAQRLHDQQVRLLASAMTDHAETDNAATVAAAQFTIANLALRR